jgi:hypothetical protein
MRITVTAIQLAQERPVAMAWVFHPSPDCGETTAPGAQAASRGQNRRLIAVSLGTQAAAAQIAFVAR